MSAMLRQVLVLYVEAALGAAAAFFQKEWVGVAFAAASAAFLVSSLVMLEKAPVGLKVRQSKGYLNSLDFWHATLR